METIRNYYGRPETDAEHLIRSKRCIEKEYEDCLKFIETLRVSKDKTLSVFPSRECLQDNIYSFKVPMEYALNQLGKERRALKRRLNKETKAVADIEAIAKRLSGR